MGRRIAGYPIASTLTHSACVHMLWEKSIHSGHHSFPIVAECLSTQITSITKCIECLGAARLLHNLSIYDIAGCDINRIAIFIVTHDHLCIMFSHTCYKWTVSNKFYMCTLYGSLILTTEELQNCIRRLVCVAGQVNDLYEVNLLHPFYILQNAVG